MNLITSICWERLDVPGTDECSLFRTDSGWRLQGHAEFVEQGNTHRINYNVDSAENWDTWRAAIEGSVSHLIEHKSKQWFLDGVLQEVAPGITQIDFGFTPATNYLQLQQMKLGIGREDDCIVAWFDLGEPELVYLFQRYKRVGERTYDYDPPSFGYYETLTIGENGFVTDYPHLWRGVS